MTFEQFSGGQPVQRMSMDEFQSYGEEPKKEGFFQEAKTRLSRVWDRHQDNLGDIANRYDTAKSEGKKGALPLMALSATAAAPKAAWDLGMEGINMALGLTKPGQEFKENMKDWLGSVITNPEIDEKIVQPLSRFSEKNPELAQAGQDVFDIAMVLPASKASKVAKEAEKAAKRAGKEATAIAKDGIAGAKTTIADSAKLLAKSPESIAATKLANQAKMESIAGRIVQGDIASQKAAARTLKELELGTVKTYGDAVKVVKEFEGASKGAVNSLLESVPQLYKINDLKIISNVGGKTVKVDRVGQALEGLTKLYSNTGDKEAQEIIKQLINRGKNEGLSLSTVNEIAREWGSQFKSFNLTTGKPLAGMNATKYENIRTGLKDVIKQQAPQIAEQFTVLDKTWSEAIKTKNLLEKMAEAVNKTQQKAIQTNKLMSAGGKIGEGVATVADVSTGGVLKGTIRKLFPKGLDGRGMTNLDIQNALRKEIINFNKLNKASGENFFNKLSKFMEPGTQAIAPEMKALEMAKVVDSINSGGITWDVIKAEAKAAGTGGYGVSVFPNRAFIKPGRINNAELAGFMEKNIDVLTKQGFKLGGWVDEGSVFLDISTIVKDLDKAKALGTKLNQRAITDFTGSALDFIETGGTGAVMNLSDAEIFKIISQYK